MTVETVLKFAFMLGAEIKTNGGNTKEIRQFRTRTHELRLSLI